VLSAARAARSLTGRGSRARERSIARLEIPPSAWIRAGERAILLRRFMDLSRGCNVEDLASVATIADVPANS
jgi:protein tyrosine phosphatase (PTP) superfamily phosphohydrolase (DUF442 family)